MCKLIPNSSILLMATPIANKLQKDEGIDISKNKMLITTHNGTFEKLCCTNFSRGFEISISEKKWHSGKVEPFYDFFAAIKIIRELMNLRNKVQKTKDLI